MPSLQSTLLWPPGAEKVKETNRFWLPRIRGNTCWKPS